MKHQILINANDNESHLYLIADHRKMACYNHYTNNKDLSFKLTAYVDLLLKNNDLGVNDIDAIYLVTGPGKFSAMRICATFAKTWTYLNKTKIFIIDKFDYFATTDCLCIISSDANKSFVVQYQNNKRLGVPQLLTAEHLVQYIETHQEINKVYESDNLELIISKLKEFKEVDENFELEYFKPAC